MDKCDDNDDEDDDAEYCTLYNVQCVQLKFDNDPLQSSRESRVQIISRVTG